MDVVMIDIRYFTQSPQRSKAGNAIQVTGYRGSDHCLQSASIFKFSNCQIFKLYSFTQGPQRSKAATQYGCRLPHSHILTFPHFQTLFSRQARDGVKAQRETVAATLISNYSHFNISHIIFVAYRLLNFQIFKFPHSHISTLTLGLTLLRRVPTASFPHFQIITSPPLS